MSALELINYAMGWLWDNLLLLGIAAVIVFVLLVLYSCFNMSSMCSRQEESLFANEEDDHETL